MNAKLHCYHRLTITWTQTAVPYASRFLRKNRKLAPLFTSDGVGVQGVGKPKSSRYSQKIYYNLDNRALWAGVKKALRKSLLKSIN